MGNPSMNRDLGRERLGTVGGFWGGLGESSVLSGHIFSPSMGLRGFGVASS